ncbi:MAG: hypothetical protein RBG13Loki_1092 [Promethearchaeota archaeon CR_4]|nr:MAG: hypothetical protein RBG13Loki_1092 [Candidatus Lokiarchaeota archaeon CR_4]
MNKSVTLTKTSTPSEKKVSNAICESVLLATIGTVALIVLLLL